MKKLIFILLFAVFLVFSTRVRAQNNTEWKPQKLYVIGSSEVINTDVLAVGERVEISGTVNGDVYAAGGQVYVDGTVNGDLLAAGGTLNISGNILQDMRIAGGNIVFSGRVGRNATVVGGNTDFGIGSNILGSLVAGVGNLNLSSIVGKQVYIGAGNVNIMGNVGSTVNSAAGQIRVGPNAQIGGDFNYWSEREASIDPSAVIFGKTTFHESEKKFQAVRDYSPQRFFPVARIAGQLTLFVLGFLVVFFLKKTSEKSDLNLTGSFWKSLGIGFLSVFVLIGVFLLLAVTIIGIPFALLLLASYIFVMYLSRVFVINKIGRIILRKIGDEAKPVWSYVVGFLVYLLLLYIPIVRGFVPLVFSLAGFGSLVYKSEKLTENKKSPKKRSLTRKK